MTIAPNVVGLQNGIATIAKERAETAEITTIATMTVSDTKLDPDTMTLLQTETNALATVTANVRILHTILTLAEMITPLMA